MDSEEIFEFIKFDVYFTLCIDNLHFALRSKYLIAVQFTFQI